jgi:hypothetical protein
VNPTEFKSELATMVAENRNHEAVAFVQAHLSGVCVSMTPEDRMLVADWMEGVEMALDLEVPGKSSPR